MHSIDKGGEVKCYKCDTLLEFLGTDKILRHEECPQCGASLHCCKMCMFYSKQSYNECKETMAERMVEKEKANFCSYFILSGAQKEVAPKDLFEAADSLFKN